MSATDLINGLTASANDYNPTFEGGPISNINDGTAGSATTSSTADSIFDRDDPDVSFTYDLSLTAAPLGYNISNFTLFSGHSDRASFSNVAVFVSTVGSAAFTQLGGPFAATNPGAGTGNNSTRLVISDDTAPFLATGVDAVQFYFDGDTVVREVDVNGSPVPEPASLGAIAAATFGAFARRRRAAPK